jgi:hypothetical protein
LVDFFKVLCVESRQRNADLELTREVKMEWIASHTGEVIAYSILASAIFLGLIGVLLLRKK